MRDEPIVVKCVYTGLSYDVDFCFRIGMFVGKRPWAGILIGLAVFLLPLPGYAFFYEETEAAKLWVPQDSRYLTISPISNRICNKMLKNKKKLIGIKF